MCRKDISGRKILFSLVNNKKQCTIALITLSSPNDINAPIKGALVPETKDSFVSFSNNINNVCKQ